MSSRVMVAILLVLLGGIAGWNFNRPSPPEITRVTEIRERAAKADTILVMDTVFYAQVKSVYDTLILRDTIPYWDTVWVKEYVQVADSTIRACDKALRSCITSLGLRDTVILYQDRYIEKQKPRSLMKTILTFSAGVGIGILTQQIR